MNRRNFIDLCAVFVLSVGIFAPWLIKAQSRSLLLAAGKVPASATCASSDTSLPHDELLWGSELTDADTTWVDGTGAGGTDVTNYNSSALSTGKVAGQCNVAWQWTIVGGTTTISYRYWDRGSAIGTTTEADLIFYLYIQTAPDDGENFSICNTGESTDPGAAQCANVYIRNNSGTVEIQVSADVSSSWVALTGSSWNKVKVHFDVTGANSSIAVNDGTPATFTRSAARGIRYIHIGVPNGKSTDDNGIYVIDLICLNTP